MSSKRTKSSNVAALAAMCMCAMVSERVFANSGLPTLSFNLGETDNPNSVVPAIKILGVLTVLSIAPAILLMMTSFTRILIVLSFVRQAVGTQTMPPNQVIVALSIFLTFFTMSPIWKEVEEKAVTPYLEGLLPQDKAIDALLIPVKRFMIHETRESDLGVFYQLANIDPPANAEDVSLATLLPAFMISEMKTAFQIGFIIYIPFLVIDMVISSVLMAMGMMMLPPTVVSLPFKLVLFVLVDGWTLIVESLVKSFNN